MSLASLLVEGFVESMNAFKFNPELVPGTSSCQNSVSAIGHYHSFEDHGFVDLAIPANYLNHYCVEQIATNSCIRNNVDCADVPDFSDACLKFINDILMEEDVDDKPATLQDSRALQATVESLYDALGETYPPSSDQATEESLYGVLCETCPPSSNKFLRFCGQCVGSPDDNFSSTCSSHGSNTHVPTESIANPNWVLNQSEFESFSVVDIACPSMESCTQASVSPYNFDDDTVNGPAELYVNTLAENEVAGEGRFRLLGKVTEDSSSFTFTRNLGVNEQINKGREEKNYKAVAEVEKDAVLNDLRGRKHHERDVIDCHEIRSNKHLAACAEDDAQMEQYDDVLLRREGKDDIPSTKGMSQNGTIESLEQKGNTKRPKGRAKRGKRENNKEAVDLTMLLIYCAQAVAGFDLRRTNDLLKQIRQHSSHCGDSNPEGCPLFRQWT
ncbi:hypothetical protein Ancab_011608 [Ancistrocladus abbreviatus]